MNNKYAAARLLVLISRADASADMLLRELQTVENPKDEDAIQDDIADTLSALRVLRSEVNGLARKLADLMQR